VSGKVLDANQQPLVGVAVLVDGTTKGVTTSENGTFKIQVPSGEAVLQVTCLGYLPQKVTVPSSRNSITIYLQEDAIMLDATVVIGYGTQKKVNLTGAVATVGSKELENRVTHSLGSMLQGSVAGLNITTSSGKPGSTPRPTLTQRSAIRDAAPATPAWKSGVMYNETVLMLKSGDKMPSGKLAFRPKKVISVRSYTLETTYTENKDYTIDAEGNIFLTQNSACPYLNEENLFYKTRPQGVEGLYEFPASSSSVPSLMYTETSYLVEKQICVTYEYDMNEFSKEAVSAADESKLPALRNLLKERAPVRLAVLGDSISEGANSSGKLNIAPYQPIYSSLFRRYVEKTFSVDIDFQNYSMGGMASEWGASRAYAVGQSMPDLVILSFGANDGGTGTDNSVAPVPVATFESNIRAAMANVRKYNPACEFILVSSLMPNPQSGAFGIQGQYAEAMDKIAENDASVVSVNMYALHEYLVFERGKHYVDLSSNNINHPNDFLIRLYAMNIISALWN